MPDLTWDEWYAELIETAHRFGPDILKYVKMAGEEPWRGYFDDEYSPRDALNEDLSYD